jgi:WD40 repeat protein
VTAVAFSRDGAALTASSGGDRYAAARLWEPRDERAFGELRLQGGDVMALAFSPDGQALLTGADDRVARVWDRTTGRVTALAPAHAGMVVAVAVSPDGRTLVTGGMNSSSAKPDGEFRLWDRATGAPRDGAVPAAWLQSLAIGPDDQTLVIGDRGGQVRFWDAATGHAAGAIMAGDIVWSVDLSPDGGTVAVGSGTRVSLWDRATRQLVRAWSGVSDRPRSQSVTRATFYPDGARLLVVADGYPQSWDPATGRANDPPLFHAEGGMWNWAFTPDGQGIMIAERDGAARLWDVATGKTLGPPLLRDGAYAVAVRPGGQTLAAGGSFGRIVLWDAPPPVEGQPDDVRQRVEALTGLELDSRGGTRALPVGELPRDQ